MDSESKREPSARLIQWALQNGFSTGHADTEGEFLDELIPQIEELIDRLREAEERYSLIMREHVGNWFDEEGY